MKIGREASEIIIKIWGLTDKKIFLGLPPFNNTTRKKNFFFKTFFFSFSIFVKLKIFFFSHDQTWQLRVVENALNGQLGELPILVDFSLFCPNYSSFDFFQNAEPQINIALNNNIKFFFFPTSPPFAHTFIIHTLLTYTFFKTRRITNLLVTLVGFGLLGYG